MKLYFICWLLWGLFVGQVVAQERGYPIIRNYTPADYDNSPQVFSAVQAANGVMYFGLNGLVMQYDGKMWTTHHIPNNSSIYSLAFDKKGTLFVGATGDFGYLEKANNGKLSFKSLHHLLPNPSFKYTSSWQTVALQDKMYFRTFEGIFTYSSSPKPTVQLYEAPSHSFFGGIIADTVHQKMYAYLQHRGLVVIGKDSVDTVPQGNFFADKEFYAGVQYHADTLLIATRNHGLFLFPTQNPTQPIPLAVPTTDFFDNNSVYFAKILPKKRIAIGSIRKGVLIIDHAGQVLQELNENTLLQNNYTRSLYVDNNGYLWITLNQGIARVDGLLDLTYWNKQIGIRDIVETVCRYEGTIYVGTHQTAYALLDNKIQHIDGLPSGQIWQLLVYQYENESHLLAATAKGIYEIKNFKAFPISKKYTNAANKIYVSHKNPRRIYTTENQKLVSLLYDKGKWTEEGVWFDLKKDIRGIVEAADGSIWLGTFRQGAVHVVGNENDVTQPHKVVLYQTEAGLPSLKDVMPFRYKEKVLFGTEYGLYEFNAKTEKFEVFDSLNQYLNNKRQTIFGLQTMTDNKLWILPLNNQQNDIGYLQPQTNGTLQWIYQPFKRIPTMLLKALYVEENGIVWLGGSEGLYRYDSRQDLHNYQRPYPTIIRKVTLEEDSVVFEGNYPINSKFSLQEIDYQYNTIAFEYALPFMEGEQRTVFKHYLEGFDKHWSEWSHDTRKEYTNLKEGNYTFWVKAKNIYGQECSVTKFQFSIQTPYYRTWWAYILYVCIGILVISLVAKLNALRIEKENRKLEALVQQRTEEISQQNEEIMQQAYFLQTANQEISIKNQELSLQKEEIETQAENLRSANLQIQEGYESIKRLNEIGQEITAVLDMKLLETTIYEQVNALMPAHSFGIGILNAAGNCLDFNGSVEKEKLLPYHFEKLDNPNSLAAYCFNHRKPILINHVAAEVHQYVPDMHLVGTEHGELPQSLIYVPLLFQGNALGVITAQSFSKNAYSERDITLLATLAS
jgi:ligand-binding sensor domain-containing protein